MLSMVFFEDTYPSDNFSSYPPSARSLIYPGFLGRKGNGRYDLMFSLGLEILSELFSFSFSRLF